MGEPLLIALVVAGTAIIWASAVSLRANASVVEGALLGSVYGFLAVGLFVFGSGFFHDVWSPLGLAAFGAVAGTVCGVVGWVLRFAHGKLVGAR